MDESDFKDILLLQLSEYEMLHSMYPREDEFFLKDPGVLLDIQDLLDGKVDHQIDSKLEYVLNLTVQEIKVSLIITLPQTYPNTQPDVQVMSNNLSRSDHEVVNQALREFLGTIEAGTLCVVSVIEWVQDNLPSLCVRESNISVEPEPKLDQFSRLWIQSHHIYSKTKMKNITDWAKELNLSGFFLAGKPGFICVEGLHEYNQIWWQRVRSMNWQKITCKLEEHSNDTEGFRKFQGFEDITIIKDGQQSDMKAFLNYLDRHGSSHVFKEYFGFDGK